MRIAMFSGGHAKKGVSLSLFLVYFFSLTMLFAYETTQEIKFIRAKYVLPLFATNRARNGTVRLLLLWPNASAFPATKGTNAY
jgi:hypothetical protein